MRFCPRTEITFPKADKDLLMLAPSFNLSPVAPVESALSEPAKSTKLITDLVSINLKLLKFEILS